MANPLCGPIGMQLLIQDIITLVYVDNGIPIRSFFSIYKQPCIVFAVEHLLPKQ